MNAGYLTDLLIGGLTLGSMYALVAIGFSMIYGIIRLINFAHGDIVMIGAFVTLGLVQKTSLPLPLIALITLAAGAAMGLVIERAAFRPMRGAPQVTGFIASLAVSIMLQNLGILLLSAQPRNFTFPSWMNTQVAVVGSSVRVIDLVIVASAVILVAGLMAIIKTTRLGMAMRATAENLDTARLMGIDVNRTILAAFVLGSGLAAVAGFMWGGKFGQIDPLVGYVPGLKSFVAAVIGGVGSVPGAILGGYLLGLSEILFVGLLPPSYAPFRDAFVFGTLILILLVLPSGLLGQNTEERA